MAAPEPSTDAPQRAGRAGRLANWAWLLLPAAIAALFAESLFGGRILAQLGSLREFEPWSSEATPEPQELNPALLDQSLVVLPWLDFFAQELQAGRWPLWNPANYLGQPIHAANTGALFWPLNWLYFAWPDRALLAWIEALEMLLGGLGMALFLKALGLGALPRTLGALAFALSGFQIAWAGHPHTHVSMLLPWGAFAIERLCLGATSRRVAGGALVLGLCALGGHLQTALHVGVALFAWALLRTFAGRPRLTLRAWPALILAAALGTGLAAAQLMPTRAYLGHSRAAVVFEQLEVTAPVDWTVPASLMVLPERFGRPDHGNYHGPEGAHLNYNELIGSFVGRIALLLALLGALGARRDPRVAGLTLLTLLALAIAWQLPPFYAWARALPLLHSTKLMRVGLLAAFGLATLAALGLERLLRSQPPWLGAAACLAVAAEGVLWARGYNPQIAPESAIPRTELTDFLGSLPGPERVLCVDNSVLIPNANLFYGIEMVSGYDSIESQRTAEVVGLLTSDPRAAWFIKEIGFFDRQLPLANLLSISLVVSAQALPAPLEAVHRSVRGPSVYRNPGALPRAFVARATERVDDPAQRLWRLGALDFDPSIALVEGDLPAGAELYSRPGSGDGSALLEGIDPRHQELFVRQSEPGLVVLSQAFDRGWHAELGDRKLELVPVDHALTGLWLPAGEHRVRLRYDPASMRHGLWISCLSLGVLLWLVLWPQRRRLRLVAPLGLLGLFGLPSCVHSEIEEPAPAAPMEIVRGELTHSFEARAQGELVGFALQYRALGHDGRGWTLVQNPWHQDLGLLDEHGRAWRYRAFEPEPELLGSFTTSEGVALILSLDPGQVSLVEAAAEQPPSE